METIRLSELDQRMLDGAEGKAQQIAMRILVRMAKLQNAEELIDISHVHIGGCIYTGKASLQVIQTLAHYGAKVKVPTTMNAISVDRKRRVAQGVDDDFAENAESLATAFIEMGANPIFSCTPYIFPEAPTFGDDIVWAESNAIAYANSVIGARTNRHGDFFDICSAITGRAPKSGLHLTENRVGTFLIEVPEIEEMDTSFYTALGYLVGQKTGEQIPVIDGLKNKPSLEELKGFSAAVSTSGPVGLYHMVGITPEAKTKEITLGGKKPNDVYRVTKEDLLSVWKKLSTGEGDKIDLVVMGSPHFTLVEFQELASLVEGKTLNPKVDFLITTNSYTFDQAEEMGYIEAIERFGARFHTDICLCMLNEDMFPKSVKTVMTNSGKFAHYGPGLVNKNVYFGDVMDCVNSSIKGSPVIKEPKWLNF